MRESSPVPGPVGSAVAHAGVVGEPGVGKNEIFQVFLLSKYSVREVSDKTKQNNVSHLMTLNRLMFCLIFLLTSFRPRSKSEDAEAEEEATTTARRMRNPSADFIWKSNAYMLFLRSIRTTGKTCMKIFCCKVKCN